MKIEERTEVIKRKVYIASDNTEFTNKQSCLVHELIVKSEQSGNVVYTVKHRITGRGLEIYSTFELAIKSLEKCNNIEEWEIEEVVIDFRFLLHTSNE